jgi:hypothetical protein
MKNNNTNKKNNNFFIPKSIVLVNNTGKKITITEKSNTERLLKKIIEGYNKIYSIKEGKGVEKSIKKIERIDDLLACKFQGEKNLHILKSSKLLEVSSLYTINYVGNLKLVDYYETDEENYDIFKINRKYYKLEGIFINAKLVTLQNVNEVEKIITNILNNFQNIIINSLVVRNIDTNKLRVLNLDRINTEFEMGIPKVSLKIKGFKGEKVIQLNEYSILFELLYSLASMKIEYFTDA